MKFFQTTKDGGPESLVWAHTLIEIKGLFSVILLRFEDGSREAYHSHAFNCVNWVLKGFLSEDRIGPVSGFRFFRPSVIPFVIRREDFHKVRSVDRTWVLSFRGPWEDTWQEEVKGGRYTLTHGRKVVKS